MARTVKLGVISAISFWFPILVMAHRRSRGQSFRYPPYDSGENILTLNVFDTVVVEWEANTNIHWLSLLCDQTPWFSQKVDTSGTAAYTPSVHSIINRNWTDPITCSFTLSEKPLTQDPSSGQWDAGGARVVIGPQIAITSSQKLAVTTFARTFTSTMYPTTINPTQTSTASLSPIYDLNSPRIKSVRNTLISRDTDQDTGLSAGTKVGIAIGVVLSAILVLSLGFLYYRNNRKNKSPEGRWSGTRSHEERANGLSVLQNGATRESARYVELDELRGVSGTPQGAGVDKRGRTEGP